VNDCGTFLQTAAAIIQAVSAVAIVILTIRLARATNKYAELTHDSLELARKQFEREWLPYWHIRLSLDTLDMAYALRLHVRNMSKNSARVTHLLLQREMQPQSRAQWPLDLALAQFEWQAHNVSTPVDAMIQSEVVGGEWHGVIEAAVAFVVAGTKEPRPSEWFPFKIAVQSGRVIDVKPKVPFIVADLAE
jgi:hypothetical protein